MTSPPDDAGCSPTTDWTTTPITADLLRGAIELEHTERGLLPHRLPAWARGQCTDGQLAMAEAKPSGVRLVLRTRATALELDTLRTTTAYRGVPPLPDGIYDLVVDGRLAGRATGTGGHVLTVDMATGGAEITPGPVGTVRFTGLPARDKDVEVWLPHNEITEVVALRTDAPLDPATERVVFDGDVVAQAEYTYQNVLKVLAAAGGGPQHLAKTIEYVTPAALAAYRGVAEVRARLLREPFPASTGLVCEALLRPEMQIEVDPFAVLD